VEGSLDFPEEETDFLDMPDIENKIKACLHRLTDILKSARSGRILNNGIRIVIIGRPNVGKSSLLNRLTQTNRAIVMASPGTTRDIIEDNILIDGVAVQISDTAGIRESKDEVEQEGVKRALGEITRADVVLLVTEADNW